LNEFVESALNKFQHVLFQVYFCVKSRAVLRGCVTSWLFLSYWRHEIIYVILSSLHVAYVDRTNWLNRFLCQQII